MLHWNDKILNDCRFARRNRAALLALLATVPAAAGCGPKNDAPAPMPAAKTSPSPAAGLPVAAMVTGVQATLFNGKGETVAKITAKAGAAGTRRENGDVRPDGLGVLKNGEAVLYQLGRPTAVMTADTMTTDRAAKTVVGTGNVRVRSLQKDAQNNASAIRADTMTWRYEESRIRGKGNVRVTDGPDIELPGENFEADTALRRFRLWNGAEPTASATGTF